MQILGISIVPPAGLVRFVARLMTLLERIRDLILPPQAAILRMVRDRTALHCLYVVNELGIPDRLAHHPRTADELARETGVHAESLYRVMRALAQMGYMTELEGRVFRLNRLSQCLRSDDPASVRDVIRNAGVPWNLSLWASLPETVRTGRPAPQNLYGLDFFEYLERNPPYQANFDALMTAYSGTIDETLVAVADFTGITSLVDVGGGEGRFLAAILACNPGVRGTLFDRPSVVGRARAGGLLAGRGIAERVTMIEGDMFTALPPGHDAYVLKWILHDWNDDEVRRLLSNVRRAMGTSGKRLYIFGLLLDSGHPVADAVAAVADITMLLLVAGRERSARDYERLLLETGFKMHRVVPTASLQSVIEAIPV